MTVHTTELLARRWLSPRVFELEFSRPDSFHFRAGQNICFMHHSKSRYYSLISAPDDPHLELCVRQIENGWFSPILATAAIGTRFQFSGPHGYFTFIPSPRVPVFVATDAGIAPFVSMARSGVQGFTMFYGTRYQDDLCYQELFHQSADAFFSNVWDLTDDAFFTHRLFHRMWDKHLLQRQTDGGGYDFYLCGWKKMIGDVTEMIDTRFPGARVYTEVFYP